MMPPAHLDSHAQAGFTLLEMLVALGIAALVVSLATARLQGGAGSSLSLEATARVMAQQMEAVRSTAIRQHSSQIYQVDFVSHEASASTGSRQAIPANIDLSGTGSSGTTKVRIVFFPDGSSSGGAFAVQRNGITATVTVDWLTGQPSLHVAR